MNDLPIETVTEILKFCDFKNSYCVSKKFNNICNELFNFYIERDFFDVLKVEMNHKDKYILHFKLNNMLSNNIIKLNVKNIVELYYMKELYFNSSDMILDKLEILVNVKNLSCSHSEIKEIKSLPPNLEFLYLNNNSLYIIPKKIKKLNKLKYLYLDNNNIKEIPNEIGKLND